MKVAFELRALFWYGYPFAFSGKDVAEIDRVEEQCVLQICTVSDNVCITEDSKEVVSIDIAGEM
jgi:hypothetical protein